MKQKVSVIATRFIGFGILLFLAMMATAGGYFRKFGYDYDKAGMDAEQIMWLIIGFLASVILVALFNVVAQSKLELPEFKLSGVDWLFARPIALWGVLVVLWGGIIVLMFPGGWNYDFTNQINELLTNNNGQIHSDTYPIAHFLFSDKATELTNQHGVILTLIYNAVVYLSVKLFSNAAQGIFVLSLTQFILGVTAVVMVLRYFTRNSSNTSKVLILLMIGLNPYFPIYMGQLTKTPLFAINFMIFFTLFMRLLEADDDRNYVYGGLFISTLGMLFAVKFAFMLLVPTIIAFSVLLKKRWRKFLFVTGAAVMIFKIVMMVMAGSGYIKEDDPIEAKTIQIQQVALYVKNYPNDIDQADEESLAKIFSLKGLANYYDPRTTDMIKSTGRFNYVYRYRTVTDNDWKKFNGIWLNMLKRHPGVFAQAFFAKTFGFFDILDQPRRDLANTGKIPFEVDKPQTYEYTVSKMVEKNQKTVQHMLDIYDTWPVLELFARPNFWIVIGLLLMAVKLIYLGDFRYVMLVLPFFLLVGVMIVSPVNNLDRYGIPYFLLVPMLLPWLSDKRKAYNSVTLEN
ncbi:DUF6020 family protein [Weissella confusa]|uniref:DUF6020 family protein n=1 Tax=Weissella confusa TaxID=1583 RepID=UPI0018F1E6E9|nr:DUF6020 family protein [Weissella confusa]MBJ7691129.1 hypothetical protein [Weissella confusa]MBJ7701326.1 hypothetical protein [Weissella confusa]